ncbi:1-deoxy-D-xylulose-5-phosphate synthase [compost metagenome]
MAAHGISLRVVNARFVKPMDQAMLLALAAERLPVITIEEGVRMGGFGSAVLEFYADHDIYGLPVKNLAIPDYFVEHGSIKEQRAEVGLTAESVAGQLAAFIQKKRQHA